MSLDFTSRPALIAYVTCGDPNLDTTRDVVLAAAAAGAEVVELGVPFSDPVADGPVIQRASERALRNGVRLEDVIDLAADLRSKTETGLIIFSYLNPVLRMGMAKFAARAAAAGVNGVLLTDLPVEEAGEYLRQVRKHKLATVFLAAPTSTDERLKRIAQASTGFVYVVSRTGVTGMRKEFPEDAQQVVTKIRKLTTLPIAVGFGISAPEQFWAVGQFAEAAVVGSAIVQAIESNPGHEAEAVAEFIKQLSPRRHTALAKASSQIGQVAGVD